MRLPHHLAALKRTVNKVPSDGMRALVAKTGVTYAEGTESLGGG